MTLVEIVNLDADLAPELAKIERLCFPTANPDDLFSEEDIRAYATVFPEGYFVATVDGLPVGMGAGIYLDFDFDHAQHSIAEITGENQCGNHNPDGEWYYGTDLTVHPDHQGEGIGRMLYDRRKDLVRRAGKRGIILVDRCQDFMSTSRRCPLLLTLKESWPEICSTPRSASS